MLYKKEGFPEDDELVLCTVTSVQYNCVFAKLDEYEHKSGMLHISEVSPGRIRNIRDYVQKGKKIVCKVLKVDQRKGHIDLSLRRVNEAQRRSKTEQIKQEQRAEAILEGVAKALKKDFKKIYDSVSEKVFGKYEYLHECFDDVVSEKIDLEKLGIEKEVAKALADAIHEKIKPVSVEIKGTLKLTSDDPEGVEIIKKAIKKAENTGKESIEIKYKGAGYYSVKVTASDYKEAEKIIGKSSDAAISFMEKNKGEGEFKKIE